VSSADQHHFPNLSVKIEFGDDIENAFYRDISRTIHLGGGRNGDGPYLNERTIYHEFGHFFCYHLHGHSTWPNSGGTHTWEHNNRTEDLTMSEGLANGFAAIMDKMNFIFDNDGVGGQVEFRTAFLIDIADNNQNFLTSPYLSERYLATCMLDLWDGVNNYSSYNVNQILYPYNQGDEIMNQTMDNIEVSLLTIFKPLWENKTEVRSINTYYNLLLNDVACNQKSAFQQVWQYNASNIDGSITNTANFPLFNTDELRTFTSFTENGKKLNDVGSWVEIDEDIPNNIEVERNITELNSVSQSYNFTKFFAQSGCLFKVFYLLLVLNFIWQYILPKQT